MSEDVEADEAAAAADQAKTEDEARAAESLRIHRERRALDKR